MNTLARIGRYVRGRVGGILLAAATTAAVVVAGLRRGTWRVTVRDAFVEQVYLIGVRAAAFVGAVGLLLGFLVVLQARFWLGKVSQSGLLGPIFAAVVVRELGPLLVNLVVLGRSGSAMAAELGRMKLTGEVRVLEALGLRPFHWLVVPRVLGAVTAVLCLSVLFGGLALAGGFACGHLVPGAPPREFLDSILGSLDRVDAWSVPAKVLLPPLVWATILCDEGLRTEGPRVDVSRTGARALERSVLALFVLSTGISVLAYV